MKKHAKQVAAWGQLSGVCHKLGDSFNPGKESMKGTALENLLNQSRESLSAVQKAETSLKDALILRDHIMQQLPETGARVLAALQTCGPPEEKLRYVNRIRKRFRYQPPLTTEVTAQNNSPGEQAGPISTGESSTFVRGRKNQLDIESKIDNFSLLVQVIEDTPEYETYEEDTTTQGLKNMLEDLRKKHSDAIEAYAAVQWAKRKRDKVLYGPDGIYGRSKMVKAYFRSKFGFRSEEFQIIRKIEFEK